ncbi:hypothetical protein CYY_003831 [Polysphondylium violaceum]|uniref:Rho-GAP domain-containing protein n=1 Tax=Polysphondylium violaceum TaxID=133409 RepID=A0A8J4Q6D0_9MYCE|nr:hypothetical protein CYY_003831 [Polysphondylium violaceum]
MSWGSFKLSKLQDVSFPVTGHTATIYGERDIVIFGGYDFSIDKPCNTTYILNTAQLNGLTKPTTSGTTPPPIYGHTATQIGRKMFVFGGNLTDNSQSKEMYQFNTSNYSWSKPKSQGEPPSSRYGHTASVIYDNYILIFGGNHKAKALNDIHIFHTERNTWTKIPGSSSTNDIPSSPIHSSTPLSPTSPSSSSSNNNPINIFLTQSSPSIPSPSSTRARSATISHDSALLGDLPSGPMGKKISLSESSPLHHHISLYESTPLSPTSSRSPSHGSIQFYINSNSSMNGDKMQIPPRYYHSCNVIGSKAYVFGGYDGTSLMNDMYVLNIDNLEWSCPPVRGDPPTPRCGHSSVSIGSRLFIFGGSVDEPAGTPHCNNDLYVFDTESFTWSLIKTSGINPSPRTGHVCLPISSRLLILGGSEGVLNSKSKIHNTYYVLETLKLDLKPVINSGGRRATAHSSSLINYSSSPSPLSSSSSSTPNTPNSTPLNPQRSLFNDIKPPLTPRTTSISYPSSTSNTNTNVTSNTNATIDNLLFNLQMESLMPLSTTSPSSMPTSPNANANDQQQQQPRGISVSGSIIEKSSTTTTADGGGACPSNPCNLKFDILKSHYQELKLKMNEEQAKRLKLEKELELLKSNQPYHQQPSSSLNAKQILDIYEDIYHLWGSYEKKQRESHQYLEQIKSKMDQLSNIVLGMEPSDENDYIVDRIEQIQHNINNSAINDNSSDIEQPNQSDYSLSPPKKKENISHSRSTSNPIPGLIKKKDDMNSNNSNSSNNNNSNNNNTKSAQKLFKYLMPSKKNRLSGSFKPVDGTETPNDIDVTKLSNLNNAIMAANIQDTFDNNNDETSSIHSTSSCNNLASLDSSINSTTTTTTSSGHSIPNNSSMTNLHSALNQEELEEHEKNKVRKKLGKALKQMIYKEKMEKERLEKEKEKQEREKEKEKERLEKKRKSKSEKLEKKHKKIKLFSTSSSKSKESMPFRRDVIEKVIAHLRKNCLEVEGIFRLSGNMDTVRGIVKSFNGQNEPNLNFEVHNVSNALKHYLRLIEPPLIPHEFFLPLLDARKNEDAETIRNIFWKIPADNRIVLTLLVDLLVKISEHSDVNKMNSKNLSIVFGPTILKPRTPTTDRMALMTETQLQCGIMQTFIEDFSYIFSENPTSGPKSFLQVDDEDDSSLSMSSSTYSTPPTSTSPIQSSTSPPMNNENTNNNNNNNNTTSNNNSNTSNTNTNNTLVVVNNNPTNLNSANTTPTIANLQITNSPSSSNNTNTTTANTTEEQQKEDCV